MSPRGLDFRDDAFAPYTKALGELALAWNDLHDTLAILFWQMIRIPNGMVPYAVWHSSKSDRAQRDMIRSLNRLNALDHTIPTHFRKEIEWLLGRVDALEDMRNDALHSPLLKSGDEVLPHHELGHQRAKKLASKNLLFEFALFYDTAMILRDYAFDLGVFLWRPKGLPGSLRERPQLPNRGETNGKKQPRQG